MQTKHAIAAGLGAPARLWPVFDPFSGSGTSALTKEKAAGALQGNTAAIEKRHAHFAISAQRTPEAGEVRHE